MAGAVGFRLSLLAVWMLALTGMQGCAKTSSRLFQPFCWPRRVHVAAAGNASREESLEAAKCRGSSRKPAEPQVEAVQADATGSRRQQQHRDFYCLSLENRSYYSGRSSKKYWDTKTTRRPCIQFATGSEAGLISSWWMR